MAWLPTGEINTDEVDYIPPEGGPLPQGRYVGMVVKAAQQKVKNNGIMIAVEFDIKHPEQFGRRKFWDNFNIIHEDQGVAKGAQDRFAYLAKMCGLKTISDEEQLIGREVVMDLYVKPAEPYVDKVGVQQAGKPKNACSKYWPVGADIEAMERDLKAKRNTKTAATGTTTIQSAGTAPAASKWPSAAPAAAAPAASGQAPSSNAPAAGTGRGPWKSN